MTDNREWFYLKEEQQHGPFSVATLSDLYASDEIATETLVLRGGQEEWRPLATQPELAEIMGIPQEPPPIPSSEQTLNESLDATESQLPSNTPRMGKLFAVCFGYGLVMALISNEFQVISMGIGFSIGSAFVLIALVYIFAAIPLISYWLFYKRRAPFEAKLVWSLTIILGLATAISSLSERALL